MLFRAAGTTPMPPDQALENFAKNNGQALHRLVNDSGAKQPAGSTPLGNLGAVEKRYSDGTVSHIDGVSVDYPTWHFNVRASNTEPLVRLNLEADTPEQMALKRDEVLHVIRG